MIVITIFVIYDKFSDIHAQKCQNPHKKSEIIFKWKKSEESKNQPHYQ